MPFNLRPLISSSYSLIEVVLLEKGELVYIACKRSESPADTLELLSLLFEKGAPIDHALFESDPALIDTTQFTGPPLWISCGNGNAAAADFLLEHGASPYKQPFYAKDSLLDTARKSGHQEIVDMLLKVSTG